MNTVEHLTRLVAAVRGAATAALSQDSPHAESWLIREQAATLRLRTARAAAKRLAKRGNQ